MIIDLIAGAVLVLLVLAGFKSGFIPTLLGLAGYLVGGFLGLISAREFTSEWTGLWSVIGLHLLLIFIGAKLGQASARSLGKGIRGIFGPLKFLDSLLGGALGGIKAILLTIVVLVLTSALPNETLQLQLGESELNQYINSHLPNLVLDGFSKVREFSPN